MTSYLDKTFCVSPDCTCRDKLTPEILARAKKWWGSENPPIAAAELCHTNPVNPPKDLE